MNFIKHYLEVMTRISEDNRLSVTHVSLYISLFTLWNHNRFENPISISRKEVMRISKIGSNHTYHKCLKELHEYGYLSYEPSHNPLRGSIVYLFDFSTSSEQAPNMSSVKNGTSSEQALHPYINSIKHNKHLNNQVNQNKNYDEPL